MLVAMAITLLMMAAVVTLFANVSNSVRNRRANVEMSGQVRHVRNVLQQDLQGATCPGLTWQRPESNHGYIELIEGQHRDSFPSLLTDGNDDSDDNGNPDVDGDGDDDVDEIVPGDSFLPRANDGSLVQMNGNQVLSTVNGLGDYDDILMLTTRNEHEPFVGRVPGNVRLNQTAAQSFRDWTEATIQSPLAEVVWFAIENPTEAENANNFFGEPGMRTIYRRTLLIAPWVNPYRFRHPTTGQIIDTFQFGGNTLKAEPGLMRVLDVDREEVAEAIAAIIAFQDRYDLSVRLEWDHNIQRWKIMANTLADLTKRENRFGHFGFRYGTGGTNPSTRVFPYPVVSLGSGCKSSDPPLVFLSDPELRTNSSAQGNAWLGDIGLLKGAIVSFNVEQQSYLDPNRAYAARPFVYIAQTFLTMTANAILNDDGQVVRVVHGPVPLWGERRGEDVMLTGALAFDLRVFDPGAPLFGMREPLGSATSPISVVLEPSDAGYKAAFLHIDNSGSNGIGFGGTSFPLLGQGAYVDMGYGFWLSPNLPGFASSSATIPWFFAPRPLTDVYLAGRPPAQAEFSQLAPGYNVYDTWSFHYENNGVNEDQWRFDGNDWQVVDSSIDEATNGLDDVGSYSDGFQANATNPRLGVDDVGERETAPPYDKPLRGVQVLMRVYEADSRAIRQVRVNQHFMPE
jgi:hypothetical protein